MTGAQPRTGECEGTGRGTESERRRGRWGGRGSWDRPAGHMPDVWARMHAELERQHAELDRIRAVLAGLTAEATSPTGDVAVTVNARGLLVGLTIAPPHSGTATRPPWPG